MAVGLHTCGESPLLALLYHLDQALGKMVSGDDRAAEMVATPSVVLAPYSIPTELFSVSFDQELHVCATTGISRVALTRLRQANRHWLPSSSFLPRPTILMGDRPNKLNPRARKDSEPRTHHECQAEERHIEKPTSEERVHRSKDQCTLIA